jgi:hypothetical protein
MDSTPLEITGASDPMNQLQVTWDPGPAIAPVAREVDITDIDSSPNSLLDNLVVNSVQVWAVNKEGVLVAGDIPVARITGLTPFPGFNDVTLTGTTTVDGPADFNGPVVMNDGLTVTAGATTLEGTLDSTAGSTLAGGTTVTGGEAVTGGLTTDTLGVTGTTTFHGDVSIDPGHTITIGGTTPVVTLESLNSSIAITQVSTTEYNIETVVAAAVYPVQRVFIRVPVGTATPFSQTLTMSTLLGPVTQHYQLYASAGWPLAAGGIMTMTGSGGTWETPTSFNNPSGVDIIDLGGTATGGETPSVVWTANNANGTNTSDIIFQIIAYPV